VMVGKHSLIRVEGLFPGLKWFLWSVWCLAGDGEVGRGRGRGCTVLYYENAE
jgi:hypothetical protein